MPMRRCVVDANGQRYVDFTPEEERAWKKAVADEKKRKPVVETAEEKLMRATGLQPHELRELLKEDEPRRGRR